MSYLHTHSNAQESHFSCHYSQGAWRSAGSNDNKLLGAERVNDLFCYGIPEVLQILVYYLNCYSDVTCNFDSATIRYFNGNSYGN